MNMGSVKMEHVCVSLVGMENIVLKKAVLTAAQVTDNVELIKIANGSASVLTDGMGETVVFFLNKVVAMEGTMIKVL